MEPGHHPETPRRITGVAGLLSALHTVGLFGRFSLGARGLETFIADDAQAVPVRVLGSGTPVVLVHGMGCSHRQWLPVARRLGRRHRVYAWDARGHGQCRSLPGSPVTLARLGRDLRGLLDHFGLERAALVGHSMGALTVMQYLQDHGGDRVAAVVLVDQSPRIVTDEQWRLGLFGGCSRELLLGLLSTARSDLAEAVVRELQSHGGGWLSRLLGAQATLGRLLRRWLQRHDTHGLIELAESLVWADFRPLLPALDLPLWVVLGGRSPHYAGVPLDAYYRQTVPHAAVSTYDRSGHSPHVAEPARFAQDLLRFLDDHR